MEAARRILELKFPIFLELIFVIFELLLEVSGLLLAASEASRLAP